jgi:hypothetical protein
VSTLLAHVSPQLTLAAPPMCADVWTFSTLTTPARLTAAVPLNPKLTPKARTVSLLFAVTATPRKVSVCSSTT